MIRPGCRPSTTVRCPSLLLACALLALAAIAGRMLLGAKAEVTRATEALGGGAPRAARQHLRQAMAYYLPGNPWVTQAGQLLRDQARRHEAAGQLDEALDSWRTLRGGIMALRGSFGPMSEMLPEINDRIAALSVQHPAASKRLQTRGGQDDLRERLGRPQEPHPGWTAAALAGFLLWVGGAVMMLLRGLTREAKLVPRRFLPLAGLVVVGFALFCAGLGQA